MWILFLPTAHKKTLLGVNNLLFGLASSHSYCDSGHIRVLLRLTTPLAIPAATSGQRRKHSYSTSQHLICHSFKWINNALPAEIINCPPVNWVPQPDKTFSMFGPRPPREVQVVRYFQTIQKDFHSQRISLQSNRALHSETIHFSRYHCAQYVHNIMASPPARGYVVDSR